MITIIKWSLGIDVGSKFIHCCLCSIDNNQAVKIKATRKLANTASGLKELLLWINKHYKDREVPLSITMEATGIYYERCALLLQQEGYRVSVVLPSKAKRYLQALGLKSKNDSIDAAGLARMGAEQQLKQWSAMSAVMYELRLLTRQHEDLQESITSFNNQLHAVSHGMYRFDDIEKSYGQTINALEKLLKQVEQAITDCISQNAELHHKVNLLCSVKGIGELSAATLIAEPTALSYLKIRNSLKAMRAMML